MFISYIHIFDVQLYWVFMFGVTWPFLRAAPLQDGICSLSVSSVYTSLDQNVTCLLWIPNCVFIPYLPNNLYFLVEYYFFDIPLCVCVCVCVL